MQKAVILITIITLASVLAFLLFFSFNENRSVSDVIPIDSSLLSQFKKEAKKDSNVLVRISDNGVTTFGIYSENKGVVYLDRNNNLNLTSFEGLADDSVDRHRISNQILRGLWSDKIPAVILTTIDNGIIKNYLYRYLDKSFDALNGNIQNISFSPNGERIVYNFFDKETQLGNISISNPDGSLFVSIFKTRIPSMKVYWPKDNLVAFHKDSLNEEVDLFTIDNKGEKFKRVLKDKAGLKVSWSIDGDQLVFSETEENPGLHYFNLLTKEEEFLDTKTTADKCVWKANNVDVICYEDSKFIKINTIDKSKEEVYNLRAKVEVNNIKLTPDGKYILFINGGDGQLYSLLLR